MLKTGHTVLIRNAMLTEQISISKQCQRPEKEQVGNVTIRPAMSDHETKHNSRLNENHRRKGSFL